MSLVLRDIRKYFGPVRANDGVTLEVERGELHGLLGENGAGKSTLMKVLSGFIEADGGEIRLDGTPLELRSPADAISAGIGMLHQDPLVFLPFSVLDNFLMGSPGGIRVDRRAGARELAAAADRFGFTFDPTAPARTLTVGERQQLEIARLIWLGAEVLIFDEPTTGISESQREKLFEVLRHLADEGLMVIFVSHKLEEIGALCHRATIMRRGRVIGRADLPIATDQLVEMMFGEITIGGARPEVGLGETAIRLSDVSVGERLVSLEHLALEVAEGEVLGLAGLEGSGQRTLLRMCAGLLKPDSGKIEIEGKELAGGNYRDFLDAGVHFLPAGRLEEGLVGGMTIAEHLELVGANTSFIVDRDAAATHADERIAKYSIKGTKDSGAETLSGGNQQRLLLAMMPDHVRVLLMEHPTRGLDLESAEWVWDELLKRRIDGTAIVFASADLDELLRYSDRVAVFFSGRMIKVVDAATTTPEALGFLIGGKESPP